MKYEPVKYFSDDEVERILREGTYEECCILPISVGEYNGDWKYAQDVCLKLMERKEDKIKANAILGLSYIARNHGFLEKEKILPYIERELRNNKKFYYEIKYAIEDINLFMNWNL